MTKRQYITNEEAQKLRFYAKQATHAYDQWHRVTEEIYRIEELLANKQIEQKQWKVAERTALLKIQNWILEHVPPSTADKN